MLYDEISEQRRVAVVGSGVSGLAAAFNLENAGFGVDLIDREPQLGGRFGVATLGDRPVMMGGKNIGRKYTAFRAFTEALGHHPYEEFGINTSRVKDGQVQALDSSKRAKSLSNVFKMAAPRDLARLMGLAVRIKREDANRFLGSPLTEELAKRYDSEPLSAHFGTEATRNLLRPMTVRMNGAEPDEVYLGTFPTNLSLVLDTFDQLVHGIQPLLETMARRVTVRLDSRVEDLLVEDGRVVGLLVGEGDEPAIELRYDGVVVATPAHAAADILRSALPECSRRLDAVRYFPTTVALVEYDRPVFSTGVRALAMDDGPCSNAGAYGRDDRHIVRYTFSGREARDPGPSAERIDAWVDAGEQRLRRYVPESRTAHRVDSVRRHWDRGYCGYVPFHGRFASALQCDVAGLAGLALAGDYLKGVSIEACFRSGEQAAGEISGRNARDKGQRGAGIMSSISTARGVRTPRTPNGGGPQQRGIAVVTGASSGIGHALTTGLAERGHPLILVARRWERLEEIAMRTRAQFGVEVEVRPCDLSDAAQLAALAEELRSRPVAVLCDNAGFTTCGPVSDADPEREMGAVAVNVTAVHTLALAVLPGMLERDAGAILVTGSAAGAQPVPSAATYAATKAFVNTFTEGLSVELRGTNVTCTLLAPGPVRTEFWDVGGVAGMERVTGFFAWQSPDRVARDALAAMERGRRVVIPGPVAKLQALAGRLMPRSLLFPLLRAVFLPIVRYSARPRAQQPAVERTKAAR